MLLQKGVTSETTEIRQDGVALNGETKLAGNRLACVCKFMHMPMQLKGENTRIHT